MSDHSTLKPCPCGKIPPGLSIQDGDTFRWKQIAGTCCQEWWIEARISDGDPDIDALAAAAWNSAPRKQEQGLCPKCGKDLTVCTFSGCYKLSEQEDE